MQQRLNIFLSLKVSLNMIGLVLSQVCDTILFSLLMIMTQNPQCVEY